MTVRIQARRDTAANWAAYNPILANGEFGFEINTKKLKIGDGITPWNSLYYIGFDKYFTDGGYEVESYANWLNGSQMAFEGTNKWDNIANSGSPGWVNLRLVYATINGKTLPEGLVGQEMYVDASSIYFVDYGYGLSAANYPDFINDLMSQFNLDTRFYSTGTNKWIANYHVTDNFFFVFEETGFIDDGGGGNIMSTPVYFSVQSDGPVITDNIGSALSQMSYTMQDSQRRWTIL